MSTTPPHDSPDDDDRAVFERGRAALRRKRVGVAMVGVVLTAGAVGLIVRWTASSTCESVAGQICRVGGVEVAACGPLFERVVSADPQVCHEVFDQLGNTSSSTMKMAIVADALPRLMPGPGEVQRVLSALPPVSREQFLERLNGVDDRGRAGRQAVP